MGTWGLHTLLASVSVLALCALALPGCGQDGGVVLEPSATAAPPAERPTPSAFPRTPTPPTTPAILSEVVVTDEWVQVESLDGSPPVHESDIERAIDTALADTRFAGWFEWFERVTVTHIRARGDGVLVRVELDPHLDPAIPAHREHGYPTDVCFVGTSTDIISGVVWLVDPGERRVSAVSPIWADETDCALW